MKQTHIVMRAECVGQSLTAHQGPGLRESPHASGLLLLAFIISELHCNRPSSIHAKIKKKHVLFQFNIRRWNIMQQQIKRRKNLETWVMHVLKYQLHTSATCTEMHKVKCSNPSNSFNGWIMQDLLWQLHGECSLGCLKPMLLNTKSDTNNADRCWQ